MDKRVEYTNREATVYGYYGRARQAKYFRVFVDDVFVAQTSTRRDAVRVADNRVRPSRRVR